MSGSPPWPAERIAHLRELCAQRPKLVAKQMAHILGCSEQSVNKHRGRYGLAVRQDRERVQNTRTNTNTSTIADATRSHVAQPDHASFGWGAMMITLYESSPDALPVVWFGTENEYRCVQEMMSHG